MAGLLDDLGSYSGDDTVKDQFGQTQADRRKPIWSGLINAGLLAVAGGGNLMPAERAKYIAGAGQALGGIGPAMQEQQSQAAQNVLRGQQVKAAQQKLDAQGRMSAFVKSPEGQAAFAKLDASEKALLQMSLDAGDMAHAAEILTGSGKIGLREEQLKINQAKLELAQKKQEQGGTFQGNSEFAQLSNILMRGVADPTARGTPEYAYAYDRLGKPRTTVDANGNQITVPGMDMSRYPPPSYGGGAPPAAPPAAPGAPPAAPGAPPAAPGAPPPAAPGAPPAAPGASPAAPGAPPAAPPAAPGAGPAPTPTPPPAVPPTPTPNPTPGKPQATVTPGVVPQKMPEPEIKVFAENNNLIDKVDQALAEMKAHPNAKIGNAANIIAAPLGAKGTNLLNRWDPDGTVARSLIAEISSLKIKELSGAAVSAQEYERLSQFLPLNTDDKATIQKKLVQFKQGLENITRTHYQNLPRNTQIPPDLQKRYGGPPPEKSETKIPTYNPATGKIE